MGPAMMLGERLPRHSTLYRYYPHSFSAMRQQQTLLYILSDSFVSMIVACYCYFKITSNYQNVILNFHQKLKI